MLENKGDQFTPCLKTTKAARLALKLPENRSDLAALMSPSKDTVSTQLPSNREDVHYTVLIRLPFPRGDFVDPPPVSRIL